MTRKFSDNQVALAMILVTIDLVDALECAIDPTWPKWRADKAQKLIAKAKKFLAKADAQP